MDAYHHNWEFQDVIDDMEYYFRKIVGNNIRNTSRDMFV